MAPGTRELMLGSAVAILRERGANALTVDAVLARSGAPRGSVYHHFPGGRGEILLTAAAQAGDTVSALLERALDDTDCATAIGRFISHWKRTLRDSDYRAGCPVLGLAIDSEMAPEVSDVVRGVFERWETILVPALVRDGHSRVRSRRLATTIIALIEGAIILSRSRRSTKPLNDADAEIRRMLSAGS